jgi:hypothetical protein
MTTSRGAKSRLAPAPAHSSSPVEPRFPALAKLPESPGELFNALAITVRSDVQQPDPAGKKSPRKQEYALPWLGFQSWKDARARLNHFEKALGARADWAPFNDSESNDGPMSLNAYPGRALVERVTNEGDACLEAKALSEKGPMPSSPAEATARWFKVGGDALSTGLQDSDLRKLAQETVTVTGFVGESSDYKDSVFDARDFGIGLTAAEMPKTILSLNRGNKKSKAWLTGKHGQGASSTYQYSDLTLIASRKIGAKKVAFTLVEGRWDSDNGVVAKTPTYRYLTVDGTVPEVEVPEADFPTGTLVRHIGYSAGDLSNAIGENSLYGLLMRSLAEPLFPVWLEMFSLHRSGKYQGYPTFTGFRRYGRLIRGTVNVLERAWDKTLKTRPDVQSEGVSAQDESESVEDSLGGGDGEEGTVESDGTRILHRASEYYQLPQWDFGGRVGVADLGRVRINYWVADPNTRTKEGVVKVRPWRDVLKNWVDPDKTVVMTLDGQTHAEESRAFITGNTGAKLWAVGRYMVVQIDCNGLDPRAKYQLFTSTREHAKETPIKKMILDELVRRLGFDPKLAQLNTQMAAADMQQPEDNDEKIASLIKKYLKAAGVSFEQLTRKVEKWVEVDEEREVAAKKPEPPPIAAVEPPTFIRWKFNGQTIKMHPGQRYSFLFETDAGPSYWNPADPTKSKIKVTSYGVRYVGTGEMRGGRVRCHFHCPDDAAVGAKGFIQVQLEYAPGAALTSHVDVLVVEKPVSKPRTYPTHDGNVPDKTGEDTTTIHVKVRRKDFSEVTIPVLPPIPVRMSDPVWVTLGWPLDAAKAGFSIRPVSGKVQLYYNAEFPPLLEMGRRMSKKSLEDEFVRRYKLKLVLHTIFTLNYDFVDEDEWGEENKVRIRNMLCAMAESLALATKSELEIEAKIKSEEAGVSTLAPGSANEPTAQAAELIGAAVGEGQ